MRVAVIGGGLQGVEAVYLAHEAGWDVTLVDKNPWAPATGFCDTFYCLDVTAGRKELSKIISSTDLVIPALENAPALRSLDEAADLAGVPLAFDPDAYAISSSKTKSNLLFNQYGLPVPRSWPHCRLPVVIKPAGSSGSQGVRQITEKQELSAFIAQAGSNLGEWVIQEFVEGPSYSIEVIGFQGQFFIGQVTELGMDAAYDCKRVLAPSMLSQDLINEFEKIAKKIANAINLQGIMDVEVILHQGILKVLEIDARLPSQTPTAVLKSTGVNMLELLYQVFAEGRAPAAQATGCEKGVVYEHVRVTPGTLEVLGEHIIATAGPLQLRHDFFGADEALTNFAPGRKEWVATLINVAGSREEAWDKRCRVVEQLQKHFDLSVYIDREPTSTVQAKQVIPHDPFAQ